MTNYNSMLQQLYQQINKIIELTKEEFDLVKSHFFEKKFKRKETILRKGEVCKHVYFILDGCIRYYYNVEGEEHTGQFFFENGWYTDFDSYLTGQPSQQNIDALEATKLLMISKVSMELIYQKIPVFEKFGKIMAENAFLGLKNRTKMLTNLNAEERYISLINERPKVIERIPQHYIASYIGIKPQSLSRIRKKIAL